VLNPIAFIVMADEDLATLYEIAKAMRPTGELFWVFNSGPSARHIDLWQRRHASGYTLVDFTQETSFEHMRDIFLDQSAGAEHVEIIRGHGDTMTHEIVERRYDVGNAA